MDDATRRQLAAIDEAAEQLPAVVKYLRTRYPQEISTPDLVAAMSHQSESETRKQLKEGHHRLNTIPGTAHGTLNTNLWQYNPTGAETPWKPEYVAGSSERRRMK